LYQPALEVTAFKHPLKWLLCLLLLCLPLLLLCPLLR
jgi:hypothetical protein